MSQVATIRFRPAPGFKQKLEGSPTAAAMLEGLARTRVKPAVEALAPRGKSGQYHESIVVVRDGASVGVGSTDWAWHWVEFGSVNNPAYAPLRSGVRAAGLRLELSRL